LLDHSRARAAALASKSPRSLMLTRQLMEGDLSELEQRIDDEQRFFNHRIQSAEAKSVISSILNRRGR
jgi:hypothetical protein